MRRIILIMLTTCMFLSGCSAIDKKEKPADAEEKTVEETNQNDEPAADVANVAESEVIADENTDDGDVKDVNDDDPDKETESSDSDTTASIQNEIAEIETKYQEYEDLDWASMPQQPANITTYEMYKLWDDELNSIWSRLVEEVTPEKKEELLADQREWIKKKEASVKAAGEEAEGGTLQPQLENGTACRYTRKRVYYLASELAAARGESFKTPVKVEESFADFDPSLDDVFSKFEGQWVFDVDRGACIGVEKSQESPYAPEGSTWTVWVTGGDIISDLDVIDYTDTTITFYRKNTNFDSYYILRFNLEGGVEMAYGNSLEAMDDVIVSY
jgi:uncharacterized protein YecT (DUF1311 family)